jgi:hypothetical protein
LVDRHIRDDVLRDNLLHQNQFTYQTARSTETALHSSVTCRNCGERQGNSLKDFLDIEGKFDRTLFETIQKAAERHGVEVY